MAYYNSYNPKLLDGVKHIHFIGCGGSGMYPLIQILHTKGYTMSGSDVEETKITQAERAMGMQVTLGHDAANIQGADLVVYSAAIHEDNPELQAAHAHGVATAERSVLQMCIRDSLYPASASRHRAAGGAPAPGFHRLWRQGGLLQPQGCHGSAGPCLRPDL